MQGKEGKYAKTLKQLRKWATHRENINFETLSKWTVKGVKMANIQNL